MKLSTLRKAPIEHFLARAKIIRNLISKYSVRIYLDKHAENILRLSARVFVYSIGVVAFLQYLGLGVEWFLGVSALTGAAIGFASTQTLGNFLAGARAADVRRDNASAWSKMRKRYISQLNPK
jgi:small-conductance mechanosensitive channel